MSTRRVKSLAVDDDDFGDADDYEDEYDYEQGSDDLSPEDQANMRQGTKSTREALGPAYQHVNDKDIQDALWNYYYDVGKTVAYIKSSHKPSQTSAAKTPSNLAGSQLKGLQKTNAQQGNSSKKPKSQADSMKPVNNVTKAVANLAVAEPSKIKSKNINVVAEYRKTKRKNAANFVVIGHIDAGKSTLMGRLLYDLKAVDQRTIDKYKKEADNIGKGSFALAWVLDSGSEERARGVTIDIAMNRFETQKTIFTILDAPGHRDFVPNMIAGASQADFALLVIDASTGNFESGLRGQTKEHALLARSIGVQRIIVAVNKMDMAEWSRDRFDEIQSQMSVFLMSAGFKKENIEFVPCSGLGGDNVLRRPDKNTDPDGNAKWYEGPTLVECLDKHEPIAHNIDKPLRMTISDVFRGSIQSPLSVSGRIEAGTVQVGEQTVIMPSAERAVVKGIDVDDNTITTTNALSSTPTGDDDNNINGTTDDDTPPQWAVAGQNVQLHLQPLAADLESVTLRSGDVLCNPDDSPIANTSKFTVQLLAFEHITPMLVDVHRGRLHVPGRISKLIATLDKSTGGEVKKKPKIVQPQSWVRAVIDLDSPVALEAPARIVVRANGNTVAAGVVEAGK